MGKRSNFERNPRDFYPTPWEAVEPLLIHLEYQTLFIEPCAGDGALLRHLIDVGHVCESAYDIEPQRDYILRADALVRNPVGNFECFITNPPWDRKILHTLITHLSDQAPTWLLFDADWVHTKQAIPYLPRLDKIVSVGRVKWIPDSKMTGKDNCAWYLFDKNNNKQTEFFGR